MMNNKGYDLGWGNPYFLMEIMGDMVGHIIGSTDVSKMSYGSDEGSKDLRVQIKKLIKLTMGIEYKHILITAGATQAINSIFRFEREKGREWVGMNQYGYPYYDDMVKYSQLKRTQNLPAMKALEEKGKMFYLIDSPGNPLGNQSVKSDGDVYWDAVYHSKIYNANLTKYPRHGAMIGSTSKLLGLAGTRIGWIASNESQLFDDLARVVNVDTATVSTPSQALISTVLYGLNLDLFLMRGHNSLSDNKETVHAISHIFDGQPIPEVGMFYCVKADNKALHLLNKANVKFTTLDYETIRISLGQTNEVTSKAIRAVLREDRI